MPEGLQRLYIAIDRDQVGSEAAEKLSASIWQCNSAMRISDACWSEQHRETYGLGQRDSLKSAALIATKDAEVWGVTQVAFKPDWTKYVKAAPFKRNDAMLDVLPGGCPRLSGQGNSGEPRRQAKKLGISIMKFEMGA